MSACGNILIILLLLTYCKIVNLLSYFFFFYKILLYLGFRADNMNNSERSFELQLTMIASSGGLWEWSD